MYKLWLTIAIISNIQIQKVPTQFHFKNIRDTNTNAGYRKNIFFETANINLFLANVPILKPLKIPENQRFSGVFRRYKVGTWLNIG